MTLRTIQIYGHGYGTSLTEITVTANGNIVFSGTVPTLDQPIPPLKPASQETLNSTVPIFSFQVDQSFSGELPMTCAVTTPGTVIFAQVLADFVPVENPVYTPEQWAIFGDPATTAEQRIDLYVAVANPPFTQEEITQLTDPTIDHDVLKAAHNAGLYVSSGETVFGPMAYTDPRSNVVIDGVPQNPDRGDLTGTWWWVLPQGSTMSYDLAIAPIAP